MYSFRNKNILIISTEGWQHIPVSKHHYSVELAHQGAHVFFLNPPSAVNAIANVEDNLYVIDYRTIRGTNRLPSWLRNLVNGYLIKKISKIASVKFDVVWSFDPNRFQNLNLFRHAVKIYHAVDVHYASLEMELASSAEIVLSVSDMILEKFKNMGNVQMRINHGLREHFLDLPLPVAPSAIKVVGYVGNLDNHCIDVPTLLEIVRENPSIQFLFIGPYRTQSPLASDLSSLKNCTLLGRVKTESLPEVFQNIDAFLMCYDGANKEVNSNHHKILEFLATGKPVIINYTDEYRNKGDVVVMSKSNQELPALFSQVVRHPELYFTDSLAKMRMALAADNSYRHHIGQIASLVDQIVHEEKR